MRGVQQPEILPVPERGRKEKYIQCFSQVFQGIVYIRGSFSIFTDYHMVKLAASVMLKNGTGHKCRRTSFQVFTNNMLGRSMGEPVRQLKKAGVIFISIQQHLQIHNSAAKLRKKRMVQGTWFKV